MSAYVVDNRTIDYIVAWVHRHEVCRGGGLRTQPIAAWKTIDDVPESLRGYVERAEWAGAYFLRIDIMHPTDIGRILLAENVRSVTARYGEGSKTTAELCAGADGYRFSPFYAELRADCVVSSCACLNYQSCETEDWPTTAAHAIMDAIQWSAIHYITRDCPWGVTDRDLWAAHKETAQPVAVAAVEGCRV